VVGLGVLFAQTGYADIRGLVTAGFRLHRWSFTLSRVECSSPLSRD